MQVQEKAFDLGRKIGKHPVASRLFCLVERILPLNRLGRSGTWVAFTHPRPSYDPHILIVPTTPFPELVSPGMGTDAKAALLWEMIELARDVTPNLDLSWQMIVNGGARQEIGQVHGHLTHAQDLSPSDHHLELPDPAAGFAPWEQLFAVLNTIAVRPDSGYSVVIAVTDRGPVTASITQSHPA